MQTSDGFCKDQRRQAQKGKSPASKEKACPFFTTHEQLAFVFQFKNGVNIGGAIQYVWLFGIIGLFVLLLACINFMNLSTARSEKRAREVGIRKTVGSSRKQIILQFFSESLLTVVFAFALSLLLVQLMLPFFNEVADKKMSILWTAFFLAGKYCFHPNHCAGFR